MDRRWFAAGLLVVVGLTPTRAAITAQVFAQATTPVPKPAPFPGTTPPPSSGKPAPQTAKPASPATPAAAATPQDGSAVDPHLAGVPIYPGAELLSSFDAGRGQFVFTFGTDMPYSDIVAYYKTQLRSSGTEIFRVPLMQQFDLGQFRAETMAYRPGVVVKDYSSPDSPGYLHVSGTTEKRYRTVIQIVPLGKS
jgi:hypothetical protein